MKNEFLLPTNLTCGYFDCSSFGNLKVSPKRICATFEIEYFLEDGKNTYANGVGYPIRRNFVRICSPGEERYSELPFQTKYVKFSAEGKLAEILKNAPRYFYVSRSMEVRTLLDEIITLHAMQEWDEIQLYGKLLHYISLLLDDADRTRQMDSYPGGVVIQAQEYIKGHYREPIRLYDIAKSVHLSPNYFHTVFSECCRKTPREYLEDYRIDVAKRFLLVTKLSLSEIAEQCGFQNQQYLSTVFKRKVGCSPAQFRQQQQKNYFM